MLSTVLKAHYIGNPPFNLFTSATVLIEDGVGVDVI